LYGGPREAATPAVGDTDPTPTGDRGDTGVRDNGRAGTTRSRTPPRKDRTMSRTTKSRTRLVAGAAAALALTLLPAGVSVAADDDGVDVPTCLAPIAQPPHSADVMQGWIDGCRRTQAARAAASLGNYL
jgi:hypothetical protein